MTRSLRLSVPLTLSFITYALFANGTDHPESGRDQRPHSFAIYLTTGIVDHAVFRRSTGDWSRVQLEATPVITERDILSYDFDRHAMKLKWETFGRLPTVRDVYGLPFVVVVDGERIYLGMFDTGFSSVPSHVPSIIVDQAMFERTVPADTLVIERAYPQPSFGVGPDPRSDERIKRALAALHKLKGL